MDILIIGGTGTISTPIVDELLKAGHQVTVLNRGHSNVPDEVDQIYADRNDYASLAAVLNGSSFDATIDMICFKPEQMEQLTTALPDHGHLIFCSTVCALGFDWSEWPVAEGADYRPNSEYGKNKAAAETWLKQYAQKNNKAYTIIRPSTTYDQRTGILRQICGDGKNWLAAARHNAPILIADGGLGMNQFMHANDCGRAFAMVVGNKQCFGKTFHVVGPCTTWLEHHKTVLRTLRSNSKFHSVPTAAIQEALPNNGLFNDIFQYHGVFDGRAIFDCIGYKAELSLSAGIDLAIQAMDAEQKIPELYQPEDWETDLLQR